MIKNGAYCIVIALLVTELFKVLIYASLLFLSGRERNA